MEDDDLPTDPQELRRILTERIALTEAQLAIWRAELDALERLGATDDDGSDENFVKIKIFVVPVRH